MVCPKCKNDQLRVVDTMPNTDGKIYRRRKCIQCNTILRTVEISMDILNTDFEKGYYEASRIKSYK